jgi:N-acetyllactosaminide beta-1,3-N-acetylglucosaminyltransferase
MYWLANVSDTWTGPISTAIFVPDVEYGVAKAAIKFLRRCSTAIRERVTFHFVSDVAHPPEEIPSVDGVESFMSCEKMHESIKTLVNVSRYGAIMKHQPSSEI